MAVMVHLKNGGERRYPEARSFHVGPNGHLYVQEAIRSDSKLLAVFAPDQWTYVDEEAPAQA